jgi:DNA helicase-2/ATP-dependent DNA helicase PcrA
MALLANIIWFVLGGFFVGLLYLLGAIILFPLLPFLLPMIGYSFWPFGRRPVSKQAVISFTANRMIYGRWQAVIPSRFIDELPVDHVEAKSETGYYDGGPGRESFTANADPMASSYSSPGWKRYQANTQSGRRSDPPTINAKAKIISSGGSDKNGKWKAGDRVFHDKFGYGTVKKADGEKYSVQFDKAGLKKVVESFLRDLP